MKIKVKGSGNRILEFQSELKHALGATHVVTLVSELPEVIQYNPQAKASALFYVNLEYFDFSVLLDRKFKGLVVEIYRDEQLCVYKSPLARNLTFFDKKEVVQRTNQLSRKDKLVAVADSEECESLLGWETLELYESRL